MHIEIATRLRPYSHVPGTSCVLPGSFYQFNIFPTLIQIYSLIHFEPILLKEIHLELKGLTKDFTVEQNLEKGCIYVWGHSLEGYFRYKITADQSGSGVELFVEKAPNQGLSLVFDKITHFVQSKNSLHFLSEKSSFHPFSILTTERLSLGMNKSQDWELIKRRCDIKEIFPLWNRLGQMIPQIPSYTISEGTLLLLKQCQETILKKDVQAIVPIFTALFLAGFDSLLSPRLKDHQHQGLIPEAPIMQHFLSPLHLLKEGAKLIRNIFVQEENQNIYILPSLPPEFHAGRFLHLKTQYGILHLEWTKKTIRRLIYYAEESQNLTFHFRHVKKFRLRESPQDQEKEAFSKHPIHTVKKCLYLFDNFN